MSDVESNKIIGMAIIIAAIIIGCFMLFGSQSQTVYLLDNITNTTDQVEIVSPLESNGAIPVNIQDQTSPAFDIFFTIDNESSFTTLINNAVIDSYFINVTNITPYSIGDYIGIFEGSFLYSGTILDIVGNQIELDTPLDFDFTTAATVGITDRELNVDGSVTRHIAGIALPGTANISVDITRIIIKMICTDPPEFSEFCDIPAGIVNGIVLRRSDGINQNYFNVKTNGDLANLMYDLQFYDQTKQQGVNGIVGRFTFAGQDKHGVTVRLNPGDALDLIIQDDLTSLLSFRIIAAGHVVTD